MLTFRIFSNNKPTDNEVEQGQQVVVEEEYKRYKSHSNNELQQELTLSSNEKFVNFRKEPPKEYLITQVRSDINDQTSSKLDTIRYDLSNPSSNNNNNNNMNQQPVLSLRTELWSCDNGINVKTYHGKKQSRRNYYVKGKYKFVVNPQRQFGFNLRELLQWDQQVETEEGYKFGVKGCPRTPGVKCMREGFCPYEKDAEYDLRYGFLGNTICHVLLCCFCFICVLMSIALIMVEYFRSYS